MARFRAGYKRRMPGRTARAARASRTAALSTIALAGVVALTIGVWILLARRRSPGQAGIADASREAADVQDQAARERAAALASFARQRWVLLTTFRRDGRPAGTPVNIAVVGDRAYVRTWETAWKARRISHNPEVEVAPSTFRGKPIGPAIHARARLVGGDEAALAARAIARKHLLLQGIAVPLAHRLYRYKTIYFELTPVERATETATSPEAISARRP